MMDKNEISYNDFAKLDIRIGKIIEAERVPDTDKLIVCKIDFGNSGERTVVSGLAEHITPEELIGKQCPYVFNLAPRKIKGIESQGMILAIGLENDFALLHPNKEVPAGTKVS